MLYYQITMQKGLALGVDQNNSGVGSQLILVEPAKNDYQLWEIAFLPNAGWNVGVALINKATGLMATFNSTGNGSPVVQQSIPAQGAIDNGHAWQTNAATETTRSVMPLLAANQCLNAAGNSWAPETPIIVWQWSPALDPIFLAGRDPSSNASYYDGLLDELDQLGPTRVEIPFTKHHWEA